MSMYPVGNKPNEREGNQVTGFTISEGKKKKSIRSRRSTKTRKKMKIEPLKKIVQELDKNHHNR